MNYLIPILCCLLSYSVLGQQYAVPYHHGYYAFWEEGVYTQQSDSKHWVHTALKPYVFQDVRTSDLSDSLINNPFRVTRFGKRFIGRKLLHKHLFQLDSATFHLHVSPLLHAEYGQNLGGDTSNSVFTTNMRGLMVKGQIGKQVGFFASYIETQSVLLPHVEAVADSQEVVPGFGRFKPFKTRGADFGMASGYVSWSPSRYFGLQLGHDRHFIGEGYRSLILSDNSFNYPFLKLTSNPGRFTFMAMYAQLQRGITYADPQNPFEKKFFSVHYVGINFSNRFQMGLVESTVWQGRSFASTQLNFINPIPFSSFIQNGFNGSNNTLLGLTAKLRVLKRTILYSQLAIDDIARDYNFGKLPARWAIQLGAKSYSVLGIRNLFLQAEYNTARPYMYADDRPGMEFSHYNQPLAHVQGGGFTELNLFLKYRFRRLFMEAGHQRISHVSYHAGHSVFGGLERGNILHVALAPTQITFTSLKGGFIINPAYNLRMEAGLLQRTTDVASLSFNYVFIGLRTSLYNVYHDF